MRSRRHGEPRPITKLAAGRCPVKCHAAVSADVGMAHNPSIITVNVMATTAEDLALALRYLQTGDARRAEPVLRQLVQAAPGNADAWHLLGAACLGLGRLDDAIAGFQEAIRLQPT